MTRSSPNILAINQYYAPDFASSGQLLAELCEGLATLGARVRVVSGEPSYSESSPAAPGFEELNGVEVTRVSMGASRGRARLRRRLRGYYRFLSGARSASRKLAEAEKPDLILTLSNPPFVPLIGSRLASSLQVPYLYVLYDIYPDVLVKSGRMRLPWPVTAAWDRMNGRIFRGAGRIIVPGDCMKQTLVRDKGVAEDRVSVIDNWAKPETQAAATGVRDEFGISGSDLVVAYTGNIGIIHGVSLLVDTARLTAQMPVTYLIVGEGEYRRQLEQRVSNERLNNVRFLGFQPEQKFQSLLAASDICFVGLKRGLEKYSVPSKAYTYMAAGKPILGAMAADSDIAKILAKYDCGWNAQTAEDLAAKLGSLVSDRDVLKTAGENAEQAYRANFARKIALEKYSALVEAMISDRRGA